MDKVVSIGAFPAALIICFAPALIAWFRMEFKPEARERDKNKVR